MSDQQKYGWLPKGETAVLETFTETRHFTILGAVTSEKVLAYMVIKGWADQYIFIGFISEIMRHLDRK